MKHDLSPMTIGLSLMTAGFLFVMAIPVLAPRIMAAL